MTFDSFRKMELAGRKMEDMEKLTQNSPYDLCTIKLFWEGDFDLVVTPLASKYPPQFLISKSNGRSCQITFEAERNELDAFSESLILFCGDLQQKVSSEEFNEWYLELTVPTYGTPR